MTDKQINKWLRCRFSSLGWLLLFYYGLMTLLTSLTTFSEIVKQYYWAFAAGDYSGQVNWGVVYGNAWGYIAAMAVGFAVLSAWKGSDYWRQEVLAKERPMKGSIFLCCLILCMGAQMVSSLWITLLEQLMMPMGKSIMPVLESVAGSTDTFSMFLYASILAPIWEELLFRGYILRSFRPFGKRFAILTSALLFGLFHGNLLQIPYAILMGLLFGYVTVEYSIFWAVALHMFNNLVLADFLSRLTENWSEMAMGSLNLLVFGGSALLSLVILSANRSRVRAWRRSEWMDRRCLKCFFTSPGILAMTGVMCVGMITMFLA